MSDQPTPETDAMFTDNVPQDAQIVAFCERLEIQRNAARAERDDAFSIGEHAMFCVHHTDAQREANTVGGNCPICNKAQIRQLRAERDSKQSQLKEVNSWLDECVKQRDTANALSLSLCADRDGDAKDRDDEIAVLRADVARLREAIVQTIAEGGNELPEWVEAKLEKALATLNK